MSTPSQPPATAQTAANSPLVTIIKILMAAVVIFFIAITVSPKARLSVVWAAGRSGGCSYADTVNSHQLLLDLDKYANEFGAASHIVQQDPVGLELVETPRGNYWTIKNDKFLRFTLAEQELEIYGSDKRGVQPGDVVLDCGANVGTFTRTALSRGAKLVVAIEPAPATVECLRRNFVHEIAEGRVIVCPKGVWDHVDVLELAVASDGNNTGNSFVFGRNLSAKVKVPLTTIDILVDELHLPRVDFIKMDIEGAEKQALRGGAQTIKKFQPRLALSAEHFREDPVEIPKVVSAISAAYEMKASSCHDDFLRVPPEVLLFAAR